MRADGPSSATCAVMAIVVTAALVSTVSAVWTCPSEREPFCCGKYSRLRESPTVLIGVEYFLTTISQLYLSRRTRNQSHRGTPTHPQTRRRIITAIAGLLGIPFACRDEYGKVESRRGSLRAQMKQREETSAGVRMWICGKYDLCDM
ncbi:hypothetical protein EMPG_17228 [Blastomyces silverae]|uniref:Hydrophobin n=1 Tax=Blastomyces silverae TaxID=2060906 RepID=A0A0H1BDG5_9EURO|nr:hypothetical protein EMPG_17228 [Blastomyces silverae]